MGAAGRTTLLYLIFGLLWVTGMLVDAAVFEPHAFGYEILNGAVFVIVSEATRQLGMYWLLLNARSPQRGSS